MPIDWYSILDIARNATLQLNGRIIAFEATLGYTVGKIAWNEGIKNILNRKIMGKSLSKAWQSAGKLGTKSATIIGLVDLAGDVMVTSDLDKTWLGYIPGSGMVELAGAGIAEMGKRMGKDWNFLHSKWLWE